MLAGIFLFVVDCVFCWVFWGIWFVDVVFLWTECGELCGYGGLRMCSFRVGDFLQILGIYFWG